jgi:hypothetical protein
VVVGGEEPGFHLIVTVNAGLERTLIRLDGVDLPGGVTATSIDWVNATVTIHTTFVADCWKHFLEQL